MAKIIVSLSAKPDSSDIAKFHLFKLSKDLVGLKLYDADENLVLPNYKNTKQRKFISSLSDKLDTSLGYPFENSGTPKNSFSIALTEEDHTQSSVIREWTKHLESVGLTHINKKSLSATEHC